MSWAESSAPPAQPRGGKASSPMGHVIGEALEVHNVLGPLTQAVAEHLVCLHHVGGGGGGGHRVWKG